MACEPGNYLITLLENLVKGKISENRHWKTFCKQYRGRIVYQNIHIKLSFQIIMYHLFSYSEIIKIQPIAFHRYIINCVLK